MVDIEISIDADDVRGLDDAIDDRIGEFDFEDAFHEVVIGACSSFWNTTSTNLIEKGGLADVLADLLQETREGNREDGEKLKEQLVLLIKEVVFGT